MGVYGKPQSTPLEGFSSSLFFPEVSGIIIVPFHTPKFTTEINLGQTTGHGVEKTVPTSSILLPPL